MAASRKALADLHAKLAEVLSDALDGVDEIREENGEQVVIHGRPTAQVMAVAAKFLKDNSIFGDVEDDSHLQALRDKLKGRLPASQDMKDAMRAIGSDLLQ